MNSNVWDLAEQEYKKQNPFDIAQAQYKTKEPSKEEPGLVSEGIRHAARTASDIGTTIAGTPGNIRDFMLSVLDYGQEKLPESVQKPIKSLREGYGDTAVGKFVSSFPTSSELQEKAQKYTGEYLKPQSGTEEKASELIKDITSFSMPGTGPFKLFKNIGIPLAGMLSKEGLKYVGGTEKEQEYGKLGTMLALSVFNPGGAKKHASELFNKSESLVPQNELMSASSMKSKLDLTKKNLEKGGSAPSKVEALKKINEIESKINQGQIPVHDAIQFRKDINEILERAGGFDVPKSERMSAIRNLGEVKTAVIEGLNDYGKVNKSFGDLNRAANESYAVIEKSNRIGNTIKKAWKKPFSSESAKILLGAAGSGGIGYLAPVTSSAVGAAGIGVYQGAKILERVSKSPTLRKYYQGVLQAGMTQNIPAMTMNLDKLDKALKQEELKDGMNSNRPAQMKNKQL